MKRLTTLFVVAIFLALSAVSSLLVSGAGGTEVDGAGSGLFPEGSSFNGVGLQGSTFGQGVAIYSDGSATGDFFTTLIGLAGENITISGVATSGSGSGGGAATFGGNSLVNMGDGTPPVVLPFSVTVTSGGLTLVLGSTTLPTQTLTEGAINIAPW